MNTKPAVKSLSIWGNLSSIGTLLALLTSLREFYDSIPPELIEETRYFITVTLIAVVQQLFALIGRWRATTKIKGLLK